MSDIVICHVTDKMVTWKGEAERSQTKYLYILWQFEIYLYVTVLILLIHAAIIYLNCEHY